MSRLVYLPVSWELADRLRAGAASGPWLGFTASSRLRDQLAQEGPEPDPDEVEYAALNAAGLAQLLDPTAAGSRLVLAADVDHGTLSDPDRVDAGSVTVAALEWSQVTALFADEAEAEPRVQAARRAVRGRSAETAPEAAEVLELSAQHDLLWYAVQELDLLR